MKILRKILKLFTSKYFISPIVYILLGFLTFKVISRLINNIIKRRTKQNAHKKEQTIINLLKSVIRYLIIIIVILLILEVYGVDTSKIIASLGIAGVVLGLALQDTIRNMLSGMFIIFDNRYNIGDIVKINDFTGEVISLGFQTTKLKAYTGEIFTIANSSITTITNYSECDTLLVLELPVSYTTDLDKLENVINKLKPKLEKIENVKGKVEILGLDSFDSSSITYKITILCNPYTHFGVKRIAQKIIKEEFDKNNIEIPYNKLDVYIKENA